MMEVKHSPSSQMDFRTPTNGLSNEEDVEMNALLDNSDIVKGLPTSSCDSTPIQNGAKFAPLQDGMEIDLLDDEMDDELNKTAASTESKKENEETEAQPESEAEKKSNLDLFDLELESAVVATDMKSVTNGDIVNSSSVRDPGDDLDTLLSKINDLVEDCMEPTTGDDGQTDAVVDKEEEKTEDDILEDKAIEPQENVLDDTELVAHDEDSVEKEDTEAVEFEEQKNVESPSAETAAAEEDIKEDEGDEELEPAEDQTDDLSEVKSPGELSEGAASEENGLEVTENDLEMAVEEGPEEIQEYIPGDGDAEENQEEEEEEEDVEEEDEAEADKELADDEIPPADTDTVDNEIVKEAAEEVVAAETVTESEKEVIQDEEKAEKADIPAENMEVDDEIVCLDSPALPEEKEENKQEVVSETLVEEAKIEQKESEAKENSLDTELPSKEAVPTEAIAKDSDAPMKETETDDDIFLIEDDDEPINKPETDEKPEEKSDESEKASEKEEKLLQDDSKPEEKSEEEEPKDKTEPSTEDKPAEANAEDEDDVVCLDDSLEESEEKKIDEEKPTESNSDKNPDDTDASVALICDESVVEEMSQIENVDKVAEKEASPEKETDVAVGENTTEAKEEAKTTTEPSVEKAEVETQSSEQVTVSEVEKPTEEPKVSEETTKSQATSSSNIFDNDVITLDDDDEDESAPPTTDKKDEEQSSAEVSAAKQSELCSDNSDNARDAVEEKDDKNEPKEPAEKSIPAPSSEVNSNSSSTNLLKEGTVPEQEESRNDLGEQPPAKRIRLSQDEACSRNSNASREEDTTTSKLLDDDDVMILDDEENKALKRVHSSPELAAPDVKKSKTELDASTTTETTTTATTTEVTKVEDQKTVELLEEIIPTKDEAVKEPEKKPVEVKPLPLYPPPNFDTPKIGLSLDFLRRFKKSIHKMTKSDLEELVLQKIVEAIVHKSEFSEMRELIEKQEKIISGHRTKITELNKQFRDLEMVHNRVLKDLETKNSQFIMPVKITRAVGLQVFFPNKKYDQPMASLPSATPSAAAARSTSTSSSTSSIADKSASSNSTMASNMPSHAGPTAPGAVGNQQQQRRGCVQKLTPMRPDGPPRAGPIPPNRGAVTTGVVSSSTPSPMTPKDNSPKILNRQIAPKPRLPNAPMGVNLGMPNTPQAHAVHTGAAQMDPSRAAMMPQGIATKKTGGTLKVFPPSKRIPKSWQSEQPNTAQPSPATTPTTSSPMVPPVSPMSSSPMTPKPPNRSVIDLTDEDDLTPAPSPRTPVNAPAAGQKTMPGGQRVGPYKVSVIPAAQLQQQPRPIQPKHTPPRPHNSTQMALKPNGPPANVVRRTPPPQNNQRYRHPAPLPNQPIHSSNPLWKLPPARPTIRISNLDSGIVISWTIEDLAKEKYAESTSYQIYAYQETSGPPLVESWRHVGDVKAMLLPMAVTLTQFQEGQRYYFAVRAVDAHNRCGPFSFAKTWS